MPGDKRPFALPKKKIEPADLMFRAIVCGIRCASRTRMPLDQVIREDLRQRRSDQIITRAAVNPATTTGAGYAAELVQTG